MDRRSLVKLGTGPVAGLATPSGASGKTHRIPQSAGTERIGPLRLEAKKGVLHLNAGWSEIPDWTMALEVGDDLLHTADASIKLIAEEPFRAEFDFPARKLVWKVKAEADKATNTLILRSTIRNESQKAMALGKAFLMRTNKLDGFFKPEDDVVYLSVASGQRLNQVQKLGAPPSPAGTDVFEKAVGMIAIQALNQTDKKALRAIRDACGDDTHLLAATGPTRESRVKPMVGGTSPCIEVSIQVHSRFQGLVQLSRCCC